MSIKHAQRGVKGYTEEEEAAQHKENPHTLDQSNNEIIKEPIS